MFATSVQTSPLSLFSSVSSRPFALFSLASNCEELPEDAGIVLVHDGTNACKAVLKADEARFQQREEVGRSEGATGHLDDIVAHIQSPSIQSTFVRCPAGAGAKLGIELAHLHLQLRSLGPTRHFSLEVGVRDHRGAPTRIRCSTFQATAKVYAAPQHDSSTRTPLLHLPLVMPGSGDRGTRLTEWVTLSLPLDSLLKHASDASLHSEPPKQPPETPSRFASVDYVQVHANCRLRRIWFTARTQLHEEEAFPMAGMMVLRGDIA